MDYISYSNMLEEIENNRKNRERLFMATFNFDKGWEKIKDGDIITITYNDKNIFIDNTSRLMEELVSKCLSSIDLEFVKVKDNDKNTINISGESFSRRFDWVDLIDHTRSIMMEIADIERAYLMKFERVAEEEARALLKENENVKTVIVKAPFRANEKGGVVLTVKLVPADKSPFMCTSGEPLEVITSHLRTYHHFGE